MKNVFYLSLVLIMSLGSCEVQKRRYQKGYFVTKTNSKADHSSLSKQLKAPKAKNGDILTAAHHAPAQTSLKVSELILPPDTCDIIVFDDGTEIRGQIVELNQKELRYKFCDDDETRIHFASRGSILKIKYKNGDVQDMNSGVITRSGSNQNPEAATVQIDSNQNLPNPSIEDENPNKAANTKCEKILFRDGTEIEVQLIEIGYNEVRYRNCALLDGPVYVKSKSSIFMVVHKNGTKELFKETEENRTNLTETKKVVQPKRTLAVLSLVFSIVGIWPLSLFGSIAGIVLGAIYLSKSKKDPEIYDRPGLAKAGVIIGSVIAGLALILLILFLIFLFL